MNWYPIEQTETELDDGRIRGLPRIACGRTFRVGCAMAGLQPNLFQFVYGPTHFVPAPTSVRWGRIFKPARTLAM
jgi:hypothetical protein